MNLLFGAALASTCEESLPSHPDRYEAWRCFYMEARRSGSWGAAEARLTAGAATDPWAEISLGHLYSDQGDPRAEVHYRSAIAAFVTRSERGGAAQARFGLANFLWHSGAGAAPPQAELELALADALATGEARLVATARAQQARHLWRTGEDYGRAYTLAKEAEADAFPDGAYQLRLLVLHVLSGVCDETGRVEEGLAYKARMIDLAVGAGDTYVEATARLNTAETWLTAPWLAAPGAALAEAERALDAARRAKNPYSEAGARCVLARARASSAAGHRLAPDEHAAVVAGWTACAAGYTALDERDAALYGRTGLAVASRTDDPAAADAAVSAIIHDAEALEAQVRGLDARHVSTELAWERGDPMLALDRSNMLLDALEAARDREVKEADRAGLGAHGAVAYDARASHLMDRGDLDGALSALERLRGRLLLEWLAGAEGPPSRTEEAVEREGETPLDPELRALLDAPPPSVADLRGLLAPDEAIVVYQLANPQTLFPYTVRSWVLVVTPGSAEVVPLTGLEGLDSRARLFEGLVAARDGGEAAARDALADVLVRPVEQVLPATTRRLILVPDGAIHRLPLAALGGALRATSTVPSLRAWLALRRASAPAGDGALAVADPTLPRAPAEVRTVVARLGGAARIGLTTEGTQQAEPVAALRALLASPRRVLHLAAHVAVDEAHPERSTVRIGDAVLHPRDVAALTLDGQLVVLSACAGASGRVVDGEGVFGIARAFLQAGARAVVASVWPVEDREAERVFTRFSDALGDGVTVDEALHIAQEDARAAGLPAAAWAGLVVVGDGGWAPFPGGVSRWHRGMLPLFGGATLGIAFFSLLWVRETRRRHR